MESMPLRAASVAMAIAVGLTTIVPTPAIAATSAEIRAQLSSAKSKRDDLYEQAEQASEALNDAQTQLDQTNASIEATQGDIDAKTTEIINAKAQLTESLRHGYKDDSTSDIISILANASSISDFTQSLTAALKVTNDTNGKIATVQEQQKELQSSLDELSSILNSHRWVCLTFDDGYQDNYTLAYPMLKRLNVPFTVYVTTGFIDNKLPMWWYKGEQLGLSIEELKALDADPLCTIGAHTVSHPKLNTLTRGQQYQEISTSKQTLESILGHEVCHFSFPHGAHNDDTLAICRELGIQTAVQSWGGPLRRGEHLEILPRINIKQSE